MGKDDKNRAGRKSGKPSGSSPENARAGAQSDKNAEVNNHRQRSRRDSTTEQCKGKGRDYHKEFNTHGSDPSYGERIPIVSSPDAAFGDLQDSLASLSISPVTNVDGLHGPQGPPGLLSLPKGDWENYCVQMSKAFKIGTVFKLVWPVASALPPGWASGSANLGTIIQVSDNGESAYVSVRRFVVVRTIEGAGSSTCIPIYTNGKRGAIKNVKAKHYAIVYTTEDVPKQLKGEPSLDHNRAIKVVPYSREHKLDETSRLAYTKPNNVEHNLRVCIIGRVCKHDRKNLVNSYDRINQSPQDSGSHGTKVGESRRKRSHTSPQETTSSRSAPTPHDQEPLSPVVSQHLNHYPPPPAAGNGNEDPRPDSYRRGVPELSTCGWSPYNVNPSTPSFVMSPNASPSGQSSGGQLGWGAQGPNVMTSQYGELQFANIPRSPQYQVLSNRPGTSFSPATAPQTYVFPPGQSQGSGTYPGRLQPQIPRDTQYGGYPGAAEPSRERKPDDDLYN